MKARLFLSTLALSAGFSTFTMAQVAGTVTLDGKAPTLAPINVGAMPQCAKMHEGGTIPNEQVVVGAGGGLGNVVVSVKKAEGVDLPKPGTPPPHVDLDQKGCQYVPHVVAVQMGEPLVAKNSDAFLHNVHSQPSDNTPINTAQPTVDPKGKKLDTKAAEYYRVKCDVHPWMSAWVAVVDTPYYAVTDKDGKFTLPAGLADGEYTLVSWHEKYDKQETNFKVAGGKADVKVVFKAAGADAGKAIQNAIPAGAKLLVGTQPDCCDVSPAKVLAATAAK